uniref:VWFA domain-containing protein n=1 Tax=Syphacia muris TaxID=451379 RepID=A0A0N5AEB7_9BILA
MVIPPVFLAVLSIPESNGLQLADLLSSNRKKQQALSRHLHVQRISTDSRQSKKVPLLAAKTSAPRSCGCEAVGLNSATFWLDVVFIVESSDSVSPLLFSQIKAIISSTPLLKKRRTNDDPMYSRVSVINVADSAVLVANLSLTTDFLDFRSTIQEKLNYLGGTTANFPEAFQMAADVISSEEGEYRRNVQKVVVLFSSRLSASAYDQQFCTLISEIQQNLATIITVRLPEQHTLQFPTVDIGKPCDRLQLSSNLIPELYQALCRANCFCFRPYKILEFDNSGCNKYAECISLQMHLESIETAEKDCANKDGKLATSDSSAKEAFLLELHTANDAFPYWIGKHSMNNSNYSNDKFQVAEKGYSNWCSDVNQPDLSKGDCICRKKCNAAKTGWFSEFCTANHYYSCQFKAYDIKFFNISRANEPNSFETSNIKLCFGFDDLLLPKTHCAISEKCTVHTFNEQN